MKNRFVSATVLSGVIFAVLIGLIYIRNEGTKGPHVQVTFEAVTRYGFAPKPLLKELTDAVADETQVSSKVLTGLDVWTSSTRPYSSVQLIDIRFPKPDSDETVQTVVKAFTKVMIEKHIVPYYRIFYSFDTEQPYHLSPFYCDDIKIRKELGSHLIPLVLVEACKNLKGRKQILTNEIQEELEAPEVLFQRLANLRATYGPLAVTVEPEGFPRAKGNITYAASLIISLFLGFGSVFLLTGRKP